MKEKLRDRFILAETQEQLDRVDQLSERSYRTRDKKAKSEMLAEIRGIMQYTDFVGFHQTIKAITLWRALSRRKLVIQRLGIDVGTKVLDAAMASRPKGVVAEIRGDFILKVMLDGGGRATMSSNTVELLT